MALKQDFTEEEEYQQQAIWELLYTEYTYLTQLAVVINVSDTVKIISTKCSYNLNALFS